MSRCRNRRYINSNAVKRTLYIFNLYILLRGYQKQVIAAAQMRSNDDSHNHNHNTIYLMWVPIQECSCV